MASRFLLMVAASLLLALTCRTSSARVLEEQVAGSTTTDRVAERLDGSGISCRTIASPGNARHKVRLASIKVALAKRIAVRAGVGVAHFLTGPVYEKREDGLAVSGGVSLSLYDSRHVGVGMNLSATRASYAGHSLTDATVLLALTAR